VSLQRLKSFIKFEGELSFEQYYGSDCNPPILVYKTQDHQKIPIYVLKQEADPNAAQKRLHALDEVKSLGFDQLPLILKDLYGNYTLQLGERFFSCLEFIPSDPIQTHSLENLLQFTSTFHGYSRSYSRAEELRGNLAEKYANQTYMEELDPLHTQSHPFIFQTEEWKICAHCSQYFNSSSFRKIFDSLPTQVIHGDLSPFNVIVSKGKQFLIDFDTLNTDVRILDFSVFLGWSYLDDFLTLVETDKLNSYIHMYYGDLEEIEYEHLPLIVLFCRCCVIHWSLQEIKQALQNKDSSKQQQFVRILESTIIEINKIYTRLPQVKEIIDSSVVVA